MTLEVLHRDDLKLGGFAGLREHRLVLDPKVGRNRPDAWPGIGSFVYLADAKFMPHGETELHPHTEVDVVSVMVEGRIAHEGSLGHGQKLKGADVQVQRAGGEGFEHNEINPDDIENRMLQRWRLPETPGGPASYRVYHPERGETTRVYGGPSDQSDTFAAKTVIEVALLDGGQTAAAGGSFMAYLAAGKGVANGRKVAEGDLLRGEDLSFEASERAHIVIVRLIN
jgi:redox-sensitive bicupin YhaK (pirin superfamily)